MSKEITEKAAAKALKAVAKKHGVSVEEVRWEIEQAISAAKESQEEKAVRFWSAVPHKGERPTPEEVIAYLIEAGSGVGG